MRDCAMTHNLIIFIVLISLRFYIDAGKKYYKNYKIVEIEGQERHIKMLIEYLKALDPTAAYDSKLRHAYVLVPPTLMTRFMDFTKTMPVKSKVIIKNYAKLLEKENKETARDAKDYSWTSYHDIDEINNKFLKPVQEKFSYWSSLIVGGESYEGRKILGIRIVTNNFMREKKQKPIVFIESGIHGREWMAPAFTTYFINQLLTNDTPEVKSLRNSFDWHIFPVVNPDGYHYSISVEKMWRKSRSDNLGSHCKGVDLNRNWDYNFGSVGSSTVPCHEDYMGISAFSEVEARSLSAYISTLDNILAYFALHTPGHCIIAPHSDIPEFIPNYTQMEQIARSGNEYSGENYQIGNAPMFFGRIAGSSMDWVYRNKQPALSYGLELKGGMFFAPSHDIPRIGDSVTKMFIGLFSEALKQGLY